MACLLVPAATAVVATSFKKKASAELRLEWLNAMLWGGVIMLTVDHILSGEIIFSWPFFTAGVDKIISELLWVGIPMTLATVSIWAIMVLVSAKVKARKFKSINP